MEVRNIFEESIDDEKVIRDIELYLGKKIDIEKQYSF